MESFVPIIRLGNDAFRLMRKLYYYYEWMTSTKYDIFINGISLKKHLLIARDKFIINENSPSKIYIIFIFKLIA